jgi:prevent-host-death family protein
MGYMGTEVKIAELKNHLSKYLRSVRQGREVVVKDRETPIARLVPYDPARPRLETIPPTKSLKEAAKLISRLRRPPKLTVKDVGEALRKERRERLGGLL